MATAFNTPPADLLSGSEPRDPRTEFALATQSTARTESDKIKSITASSEAKWATCLAAAPSAVGTMAILFKAASTKAVAGLEVESVKIPGKDGAIVGELPHKLFHANLQYCSNTGRSAFLEAQKTMYSIHQAAQSMIKDDGSVAFIIDLLEDPDDAKFQLKPAMKGIEDTAQRCLEQITSLCKRFEYWHCVICCLNTNAVEGKGMAQKEKNEKATEQEISKVDKKMQAKQAKGAEKMEAELQHLLESAKQETAKAEKDVRRLDEVPPTSEPSHQEDLDEAMKEVSMSQAPQKEDGAIKSTAKWIKKKLVGESEKDYKSRVARFDEEKRQQREYIEKARAQREKDRELAAQQLKAARDRETELRNEIIKVTKELKEKEDQHAEAKANLLKTKAQIDRLSAEKVELNDILRILEESCHQLGKLREHVEQLVEFFDFILVQIDSGVNNDIAAFLKPIENGAEADRECIRLGKASKKNILAKAVDIQGRFSAIRDISGAFVHVSSQYISLALSKMQTLASVSGNEEWRDESEKFTAWCEDSMKEIEEFAHAANAKIGANIDDRASYLKQHAIEAAAANR
ncbi:hypothetical protein RB601_006042 [Gaeumannomyces tritici]